VLEPKEITVNDKVFVIHKLPATAAIEIMVRGLGAAIPNAGEFPVLESMMIKMMGYVMVRRPNLPDLTLNSKDLIDNHCVDYKTYLEVLDQMSEYNQFFFLDGKPSDSLKNLILTLPTKILKMLTPLSQPSSMQDSQPSENLEQSTH
jgi:hypothetical protein